PKNHSQLPCRIATADAAATKMAAASARIHRTAQTKSGSWTISIRSKFDVVSAAIVCRQVDVRAFRGQSLQHAPRRQFVASCALAPSIWPASISASVYEASPAMTSGDPLADHATLSSTIKRPGVPYAPKSIQFVAVGT